MSEMLMLSPAMHKFSVYRPHGTLFPFSENMCDALPRWSWHTSFPIVQIDECFCSDTPLELILQDSD